MSSHDLPLDEIEAIIFDFGGVILPLRYEDTIARLSELLGSDVSHYFTRLKQDPLFDDFETGHIEAEEFRFRLWSMAAQDPEDDDRKVAYDAGFDAAWSALLQTIPAENLDLLDRLRREKQVFLLSNTNPVHLKSARDTYAKTHPNRKDWDAHFHATHYSHLMGLRKPDPKIFQQLVQQHGLNAARTLFLDDNADNVAAAAGVGLVARIHPKNAPLVPRFSDTTAWAPGS